MVGLYVSLGVLAGMLAGIFLLVLFRSWNLNAEQENKLRGLAIPRGSVRALLAFLVLGSFVIFVFFGEQAVEETETFNTVLTAFATLTGSVIGFYFGTRGGEQPKEPPVGEQPQEQPDGEQPQEKPANE